jgi:predicted Ser/Thr protein kinase
MTDSIPVALGRYVILEEIGRGMMGAVYRAADPDLGRVVALKTVRLAFAATDSEREQFEQRFLTEARAAGGLSHPGIVVVHDVGRDADTSTLFIALEFLEGRTLDKLVSEQPLDWREALRLTARVAEALTHAHERGIVHRDVKPANIMVQESGEPKIMDFGVAKVPASQLTMAGQFFGTPAYMSPEQAAGEDIDGRSDLFSLGSILYLLLTGCRAFDGNSIPAVVDNVRLQDPPPPSKLVPGIPSSVDYVVRRALAKRPADRYASGRMLSEDAEDVRAGREPRHRAGWRPPAPAVSTAAGRLLFHLASHGLWRRAALVAACAVALYAFVGMDDWPGRTHGRSGDRTTAARPSPSPSLLAAAEPEPSQALAVPTPGPEKKVVRAPKAARREPARRWVIHPPPRSGLRISLKQSLKRGRVRVWIDEDLVLDSVLPRTSGRSLLAFKLQDGGHSRTLAVAPGAHLVRMSIESGDDSWTESISGELAGGIAYRLDASLGGLLKRRLSLDWANRPKS